MSIILSHPTQVVKGKIQLTSSKSESNRALIIRALCEENFKIENLSISDDTVVLQQLLQLNQKELNVGLAGTVMRFLTAFLAIKKEEVILTGAHRMKERPIKILVEVLKQLGAEIEYIEKEGFPPIKIVGKELEGGKISIDGSVSSQYISALLLIAPKLKNGLQITFLGEVISKPYIDMTIKMMRYFGVSIRWEENTVVVEKGKYLPKKYVVEADWSAASYWYSFVALSKQTDLILYGLKKDSLQGDAVVVEIYKNFGVETEFIKNGIRLTKISNFQLPTSNFQFNFTNCPDIAQTVAVTCAALNVEAKLTGLKTLRIKETDRVEAIQTELNKLGFNIEVNGDDVITNSQTSLLDFELTDTKNSIKTYKDHRMAMAFAPLALLREITIEEANVVSKSYPNFWEDLLKVGFKRR